MTDIMTELLAALHSDVDAQQLPGAVVAVTAQGSICDMRAIGYADPDARLPMRDDAIFRIYSMTKVISAMAALDLVAEGRLRPEDPVADWLADFADVRVREDDELRPPKQPLRIVDLMRQTGGIGGGSHTSAHIRPYYEAAAVQKYEHWAQPASLEDVVRKLASLPLSADPGTGWEYGMAMDILGRILELADGRPLNVVLRDRVCLPLGLRDTDLSVPGSERDRVAQPFRNAAATPPGQLTHFDTPRWLSAGSGGYSTAADFARLLCAFATAADGAMVVSGMTPLTRELFVDQINELAGTGPDYIPGAGYGFSFGLHVPSKDPSWAALSSHMRNVGWLGRAGTCFVHNVDTGVGAVLMMQCYGRAIHYRDFLRSVVARA